MPGFGQRSDVTLSRYTLWEQGETRAHLDWAGLGDRLGDETFSGGCDQRLVATRRMCALLLLLAQHQELDWS